MASFEDLKLELEFDVLSKNMQSFEQNKVEGLSGWDPFQKWVCQAGGGLLLRN